MFGMCMIVAIIRGSLTHPRYIIVAASLTRLLHLHTPTPTLPLETGGICTHPFLGCCALLSFAMPALPRHKPWSCIAPWFG